MTRISGTSRAAVVAGAALLAASLLSAQPPRASGATPAYAWSLVAASPVPASMHPGLKVTVVVVARNDGTQTWEADGVAAAHPVRLAPVAPAGRASLFASEDPTWMWSGGTRIRMETPVVPPGGNGVFVFTFTAPSLPSYPQSFTERFAPVAEGVAVMDATTVALATTVRRASSNAPEIPNPPVPPPPSPPPPPTGPAYDWSAVAVTPVPSSMHPGLKAVVVAVLRNEGTATWQADSVAEENPVRLAAVAPLGRASAFASDDPTWMWSGGTRVRMTTPIVEPGGLAAFTFTFTAPQLPSYPQSFTERFAPVAEGLAVMDEETIALSTTVRPASSNVPPLPNPGLPTPPPLPCDPVHDPAGCSPVEPPSPLPTVEPPPAPECVPSTAPGRHRDVLPPAAAAGYAGTGAPVAVDGLGTPNGVGRDPNGRLVVADTPNDRVLSVHPSGAIVASWGGTGSAPGQMIAPSGIAVADNLQVYVADTGNNRIQVFGLLGTYLRSFGGAGTALGKFNAPRGLAIVPSGQFAGHLAVADTGNDRIQILRGDGQPVASFDAGFDEPRGVSVYQGEIYVADTGNDRVVRVTLAGQQTGVWGGEGSGAGCMRAPAGVLANEFGLFVADTGNDRVQRYSRAGPLLEQWGARGAEPNQMREPAALAADAAAVWVAEAGGARLQRFTPSAAAAPPVPCGSDPVACFPGSASPTFE